MFSFVFHSIFSNAAFSDYLIFQKQSTAKRCSMSWLDCLLSLSIFFFPEFSTSSKQQILNMKSREGRRNENIFLRGKNNWLSEVSLSDTLGHFFFLSFFFAFHHNSVHLVRRNCVLMLLGNLFVCRSDKSKETNEKKRKTKAKKGRKLPHGKCRLMPVRMNKKEKKFIKKYF